MRSEVGSFAEQPLHDWQPVLTEPGTHGGRMDAQRQLEQYKATESHKLSK